MGLDGMQTAMQHSALKVTYMHEADPEDDSRSY